MSILDDVRLLYMRDGGSPGALLRMATCNGAKALGLDLNAFTFRPGADLAGLVAVDVGAEAWALRDPAAAVMTASTPPRLLLLGN